METSTTSVTDSPGTTYVQVMPGCPYCGMYHESTCPRVEELEYYPDGVLKRVKLRPEPVKIQVSAHPDPSDHSQVGHICGVDCPETVW